MPLGYPTDTNGPADAVAARNMRGDREIRQPGQLSEYTNAEHRGKDVPGLRAR